MQALTSLLAYNDLEATLNDKQEKVYQVISERGPLTNKEIADFLGWEINRVTGRTTELRNQRKVFTHHLGKCPVTGSTAKFWTTQQVRSLDL